MGAEGTIGAIETNAQPSRARAPEREAFARTSAPDRNGDRTMPTSPDGSFGSIESPNAKPPRARARPTETAIERRPLRRPRSLRTSSFPSRVLVVCQH